MSDTTERSGSGHRQCYFCGVSTLRGPRRRGRASVRSYQMTNEYLTTNPYIAEYSRHLFSDTRQITQEDRICLPCFQRARRFSAREARRRLEQEELEISIQSAINEVFEPSSASESFESDPVSSPVDLSTDEEGRGDHESIPFQEENPPQEEMIPPAIALVFPVPDFSRTGCSSSVCLFRSCRENEIRRIPLTLRTEILRKQNLFITHESRVCNNHLHSEVWHDIAANCRSTVNTFNSEQMSEMLKLLQEKNSKCMDFETLSSIDDVIFHFYIGYSKENFLAILEETPSISRHFKKSNTALATVLCKLHTGDSNERLSSLFRMTSQHFGKIMKRVRNLLKVEFIPKHLGFDHIYSSGRGNVYRSELSERNLRIPNVLYGTSANINRVISICDGTYFYIQKSSNYKFQRKTYSSHKYRHLFKVFLITSTDGYIIESFGPYPANKSDADIMSELIDEREENPFHWFFEKHDVFILDRGFRDAIECVEEKGYKAFMPATKSENERQLSTQQANESRKVTLCRWVVETINGRLKNQFRQLRSQNSNIAVPHMYDEVRIACALVNAFGARLTDNELSGEIINEIHLKHDAPNYLANVIIENNFNNRRAFFRPIDASEDFGHFPILTYEELNIISLGPYQVEQARSYYGEHVKRDGSFTVEVYEESEIGVNLTRYNIVVTEPYLLRGRIQSRHQNRRVYFSYILIDNALQGRNQIIGYYCSCLVGKRTLGCCAHVMCIIWYMAWARHQDDTPEPPAGFLDVLFMSDDEE